MAHSRCSLIELLHKRPPFGRVSKGIAVQILLQPLGDVGVGHLCILADVPRQLYALYQHAVHDLSLGSEFGIETPDVGLRQLLVRVGLKLLQPAGFRQLGFLRLILHIFHAEFLILTFFPQAQEEQNGEYPAGNGENIAPFRGDMHAHYAEGYEKRGG